MHFSLQSIKKAPANAGAHSFSLSRYSGTVANVRIAAIGNLLAAASLRRASAQAPQLGSQPSFTPLCTNLILLCHY